MSEVTLDGLELDYKCGPGIVAVGSCAKVTYKLLLIFFCPPD